MTRRRFRASAEFGEQQIASFDSNRGQQAMTLCFSLAAP